VSAASFDDSVIIGPSEARSAVSGMRLPMPRRYATSSIALTRLALTYARCGAKPWMRPQLSTSDHELIPLRFARKRRTARIRSIGGKRAGRAWRVIRHPRPGRTLTLTAVRPPERIRMRRAQRSVGGSSSEQLPSQGRW
jgi:hypothetical protein